MRLPGHADGYSAVLERFRKPNRPDGLFCFNDEVAIGANRALSELGLRVPEDVAIIGSDGIVDSLYAIPSLSTVAQPFDEMCSTAWTSLMQRIAEPKAPIMGAVLPMQLIPRGSTRSKKRWSGGQVMYGYSIGSEGKSGFTLIELLVVIAIIAIISAILYPVFATAREKARESACLSNMKQVAIGVIQYAQDYDETPPNSYVDSGAGAWGGQIYPYVKSAGAFRCPDDALVINEASMNGENDSSYCLNANLATGYYSLAKYTAPAMTVLFCEVTGNSNTDVTMPVDAIWWWQGASPTCMGLGAMMQNGWQDPGGGGFINSCPPEPDPAENKPATLRYATGPMGGRAAEQTDCRFGPASHSGGSNFALCDGHVKWMRPETVSSGNMPEYWYYWGWGGTTPTTGQDSFGWCKNPAGTSGTINGNRPAATFSFI